MCCEESGGGKGVFLSFCREDDNVYVIMRIRGMRCSECLPLESAGLGSKKLRQGNCGQTSSPPSLESGHSSPVGGHKLTWFYSDLAMNC